MTVPKPRAMAQNSGTAPAGHGPGNLGDILERVLDRGIVIVGDIRVSLLDIELLTLKLRLVVASVDTARQIGIDWWENDPWLSSRARSPVEPGSHNPEIEASGRVPGRAAKVERDGRKERDEHDG